MKGVLSRLSLFEACLIFFVLSYLPFLNQVSALLNGLFFLNVLLSIFQVIKKRLLSKVILIGLLGSGLALIFQEYQTLWGLEPGVAVLSLMASLKLFEIKEKRDFYLFFLICELALIGHVLTVDDLYMVFFVLIFTLILFFFLFHFQKKARKWEKRRKIVFFKIFLYSLPLALILFFAFPRLPLGNLFFNTIKKESITGFSDELRPGELEEVVNSNIPYFRAKFHNDKTPTYFELYWRGAILSKTDGFKWSRIRPPGGSQMEVVKPVKYSYEVSYDKFMNSPLFLLENSMGLKLGSRGHPLKMGGATIKFFPYSNKKISYKAQTGRSVKTRLNDQVRNHFLQVPKREAAPRFFKWVEDLKKDQQIELRQASLIFQRYLGEKKFTYTLKPGRLSAKAPLDQFFFDTRLGFCEHFSSSYALFLRLMGIPSRVVVGFHGGEYNPLGQYYLVKGRDAHAWVEAWDERKGWVRFDPTGWVSPDRIRYGAQSFLVNEEEKIGVSMDVYLEKRSSEFWQGLFFAIDMLYYEANREFVGFDLDRQKSIFTFLGKTNRSWPWKLLALCIGGCLILLIPLLLILRRDREEKSEVARHYVLLRKKLARAGIEVRDNEGPLRLLEKACEAFPSYRDELSNVIFLYSKLVYGKEEGREKIKTFSSLVRELNLPKLNK